MDEFTKSFLNHAQEESGLVRMSAQMGYALLYQQWVEETQDANLSDFEKVAALDEIAERPLLHSLCHVDRRLFFGLLRSAPLHWIAEMTGSEHSPFTIDLVRRATKIVLTLCPADRFQVYFTARGTTAVYMDSDEADSLFAQLPLLLGGLLAGSIAKDESERSCNLISYGARLNQQKPPFQSTDSAVHERIIPEKVPRVDLHFAEDVATSLKVFFERRSRHQSSSIAGIQSDLGTEPFIGENSWWILGIPTIKGKYPATHDIVSKDGQYKIGRTSYVLQPISAEQVLLDLTLFEDRFSGALGMTFDEFRHFSKAIFALVFVHSRFYALERGEQLSEMHTKSILDVRKATDASPQFLQDIDEVWNRGAIRNTKSWFVETLFDLLEGSSSRDDCRRWIDIFTVSENYKDWLKPFLFYPLANGTLVLDLFEFVDFHERVLRTISSNQPGVGDLRGRLFEDRSTGQILGGIGMFSTDPDVIVGHEMRFKERNYGDVDLAIVIGSTLVNIDMKSRQKDLRYFCGTPTYHENRQKTLVTALSDKVTPRGEKLKSVLNNRKEASSRGLNSVPVTDVISFLCVAAPEFLSKSNSTLWYDETPRVLTPQELVSFIQHLGKLTS